MTDSTAPDPYDPDSPDMYDDASEGIDGDEYLPAQDMEIGPSYSANSTSYTPGQQQYEGPHYQYQRDLYTSDFLGPVVAKIQMSHLSPRAKRQLISSALEISSNSMLLSSQTKTDESETSFLIQLNLVEASCNKVDVNLPEYPHLLEQLRELTRLHATRTVGKNRERMQQNRQTIENIQQMGERDHEQNRKKGFGLFSVFGRGGD